MTTNKLPPLERTYIDCHHCKKQIVWCAFDPPKKGGYYAHPITTRNGKTVSIGNALMEQRCQGKDRTYATPAREQVAS